MTTTAPAPLVVPLDIAVQIGRLVLDDQSDDYSRTALAKDVGALRQALRQVLDALDTEQVTA